MTQPTVTVLGAGYVGLTTAVLLANAGYKVFAIEPNKQRLAVIKQGRSFFYEEGMDGLIKTAIESGNLVATDSYSESISASTVVFSCVGTPDNPDGSSNLTYVFSAATEAATYMTEGSIYVQKSTVPVGTGERVIELFNKANKKLSYVSNPEFLREGTAIYDTLYFDRVVAGGTDKESVENVLAIYKDLEANRDSIAQNANISPNPRLGKYIATSLNSAELIKVTSNAFLALKISFANSIAKLSDAVGADVIEVMDAVGADERIGRAFLNAGRGYGGGCFPKDVSGLIASGLENGVDLEIMTAAQSVNESMPGYILEKLQSALDGDLAGKKIAVLGLAFKAGTSDARKSPGVSIANTLLDNSAVVSVYDPQANEEARHDLDARIIPSRSIEEAIVNAEAIIIATEWPEFSQYSPSRYKENSKAHVIIDAVNRLDRSTVLSAGFQYVGVGR
jgi:UDPglucose 6-dehydrogenase